MALPISNAPKNFQWIIKIFQDFAVRSRQIKGNFGFGPRDEMNSKYFKYPYLYVVPVRSTIITNDRTVKSGYSAIECEMDVIVADKLRSDYANMDETTSDINEILISIISEFAQHPYYSENRVQLVRNVTIENEFKQNDANENLAIGRFVIRFPFKYTFCSDPVDELDGSYTVSDILLTVTQSFCGLVYDCVQNFNLNGATGPTGSPGATGPAGPTSSQTLQQTLNIGNTFSGNINVINNGYIVNNKNYRLISANDYELDFIGFTLSIAGSGFTNSNVEMINGVFETPNPLKGILGTYSAGQIINYDGGAYSNINVLGIGGIFTNVLQHIDNISATTSLIYYNKERISLSYGDVTSNSDKFQNISISNAGLNLIYSETLGSNFKVISATGSGLVFNDRFSVDNSGINVFNANIDNVNNVNFGNNPFSVTYSSLNNGEILVYNNSNQKWVNYQFDVYNNIVTEWVDAGAFLPSNVSGATPDTIEFDNGFCTDVYIFGTSSTEYIQFKLPLNNKFNGDIGYNIHWLGLTSGSGTASFNIETILTSDGQSVDNIFTSTFSISDSYQGLDNLHITQDFSNNYGTISSTNLLQVRLSRDLSKDTLDQDVYFLGLEIKPHFEL